ncbi:DEAD/DEAH box helicase family protein [Leptolyngbya sp. FACHB-321]|uniref:SNF2-related protein n=1 Tax=Leptolyngbya sp. FACHB-321 TaxID=2692807 RepID=UPI0016862206|nr:SNF2-related protein [Leptolyngbya sp. FACHB-321]MBD2038586.1 DEAD/DEAH box helicase family protein [Leptolyngbya sp. FACHB-321]
MRVLRDRSWKINYSSDENNPVADFYVPALERAIQYDRKAGFFNSTILSKVARGLGAMLQKQGRMRLIMGCQFSPEDLQAIKQGYELRDALAQRLDTDLQPPKNFAQLKHFEILSWLIQNQHLDIRIAVPLKTNGLPEESERQLDHHRIFHEKVGIITDANGDQLAFSGSNNESIGGWEANLESFHVYFSWDGGRDLERVQLEGDRFNKLWADQMPNVRVFEVPEAVRKKLLRYAPSTQPRWNQQAEFDTRPLPNDEPLPDAAPEATLEPERQTPTYTQADWEREYPAFVKLANLHQDPGCLDFTVKSIPLQPWAHQLKILHRVAQEFPRSYLIADEVGLGKTIETGLVLRYLILSKKVKRVLILAPASVQPQWQEELREKFNLHFWSYLQGELRDPYKQTVPLAANPWNTQNLMLASSHLVRRKERMQELLEAEPWDLVVLDEAHHARRKSPQERKDTPNRLLELMRQLRAKTTALLLLSATPMQIDTIEVFDLLSLLGLEGHWQYGDNFCAYFATLAAKPDRFSLDFWQQMSTDYFKLGGQACPRLQQHLELQDRLLTYKLRDLWHRGDKIVNSRPLLEDEAFIAASRQYLTVNTPLKDRMFRHTRDTLRQYYRRGLLAHDIPTRQVQDNAIVLEALREAALYRAVSDYVRHFYRLAQKENRKALGFLMTLYRKRLTSSFYAVQQSLQRRLDALLTQHGNGLTADDLAELDDAEDVVIEGLESYLEPIDPKEIQYLEDLLWQFDNTGEDTKCAQFISTLRQELNERESAIVFTQYTDTMDYLRDFLSASFGSLVACYSGRGGELYRGGEWCTVPKEDIKSRFREGELKLLLCTESASEGLNLQICGVLFNYDLPWNPMRVEQRIGRIDRIGQRYSTVRIHNFYYDGTVEAKVYKKLRDRINAFATVVGNLQPILAKVPTFIERAVMSADPEEENVLLSEFDQALETPPLRPALDEMVAMDVESDLAELRKPIAPAPVSAEDLEQLFTTTKLLQAVGATFEQEGNGIWKLTHRSQVYRITFSPAVFDEQPSLRFMTFGEPLFESLLLAVSTSTAL